MNTIQLIGRITKTPELKVTNSGKNVTTICVATPSGKDETAFIDCVAWNKTAEVICQYLEKGNRVGVTGQLQTRNYEDKNGNKRTAVEVLVREIDFLEPKKEADDFPPDDEDDELPF